MNLPIGVSPTDSQTSSLATLIIPEPVGRLIRRAKVTRENGKTVLSNAHPGSEFTHTRDINFRPLWATTSPDGAMMMIDMHRCIIQQGNWTRPGSYLRGIIDKWGIHKNIGKGRIYRLSHDTFKPDKQPRMLDESTKDLVAHLSHPNGWQRDTAQKLIILRKDRHSVIPALEELAKNTKDELARMHALWTLEGISKAQPSTVATALADSSALVRIAAVRIAEPFMKSRDKAVISAIVKSPQLDDEPEMYLQAMNSIRASGTDDDSLLTIRESLLETHADNPAIVGIRDLDSGNLSEAKKKRKDRLLGKKFAKSMDRRKVIYQQLCFSCHGADGTGTPMPGQAGHKLAPSFAKNPRLDGSHDSAIRTILHGFSGDLDGKNAVTKIKSPPNQNQIL